MSIKTDNTQTLVNALAEIERLRGRVSELENWNEVPVPSNIPQARAMALAGMAWLETNAPGQLIQPYVLRKQADAIEAAAKECMPGPCGPPDDPPAGYQEYCEGVASVTDYAQRLRNQADELEGN